MTYNRIIGIINTGARPKEIKRKEEKKMAKMNRDEAIEFAQYIAFKDEVDFSSGEGKVVVFKNAVAIMEQDEDESDQVRMQFIINDYTDATEIVIEDEITIKAMIDAMLKRREQ